MQPYPDVPFRISGLDPAILRAWTRTGLCDSGQTTAIMHSDRLMDLRSLVRMKPLISKDELVEEGAILDRNEKRSMGSKSVSSVEAKHSANQRKEMAKEVQGTIEALKKRIEQMDVSDEEELEEWQYGNKVIQVTPNEAPAAPVTRSSPLSGVKVGPSLSTKLNYILSEVCTHTCIDYMDHIPHARRYNNTRGRKSSLYFLILSSRSFKLARHYRYLKSSICGTRTRRNTC